MELQILYIAVQILSDNDSHAEFTEVDVFLTLRYINWFFTLYGCTRFSFVEGQHRTELTSRAIFGYKIDKDNLGIPLEDDNDRFTKHTHVSSIFKKVSASVVCDKTVYNPDDDDLSINTLALQIISNNAQELSVAAMKTPPINCFRTAFTSLEDGMNSPRFLSDFLNVSEKTIRDMNNSINTYFYTMANQKKQEYSVEIARNIEKMIIDFLINKSPFCDYISEGRREDQKKLLEKSMYKTKKPCFLWHDDDKARGPRIVFHHSFITHTATGTKKAFNLKIDPYNVHDFVQMMKAKNTTTFIQTASTNCFYETQGHGTFVPCLHSMVIELTQFCVGFPFVREAFLQMVSSFEDTTLHPMNNPDWFCFYILAPCKTIAETVVYHITKARRVLTTSTVPGESKKRKRSTPDVTFTKTEIIDVDNEETLRKVKVNVEGNLMTDDTSALKYYEQMVVQQKLTNELSNILSKNLDAYRCDKEYCEKTVNSMSSYPFPRLKLLSLIYARSLEMYFNLLQSFSTKKTLAKNPTLEALREEIADHQAKLLLKNSK
jgi:hypothetical protein